MRSQTRAGGASEGVVALWRGVCSLREPGMVWHLLWPALAATVFWMALAVLPLIYATAAMLVSVLAMPMMLESLRCECAGRAFALPDPLPERS